jgi:3-dehydroquinate dehydratase-2
MSTLIYILNGPNLNLLGLREPEIYGSDTLADLEAACRDAAAGLGLEVETLQSNYEGQIVDWIHQAREKAAGIIINPAALSHTSVAVLDALNMYDGPVIEVHISQIHKRESFRHHSYVSHRADAMLVGTGIHGYVLALEHMKKRLTI